MGKIVWAVLAVLAVMQLVFAFELMELSSLVRRVQDIEEKTAMVKNQTALMALENERLKADYYRIMSTNPFTLTEEEARGIIKSGVRNESK